MIGVGIIGYGYWGPNLARAAAESGVASVQVIADPSPQARQRAALRHPAAKLVSDVDQMLSDKTVDAVLIATPVHTHFALAMAALKAGKHVLVEKPMTETVAQAHELVEEAARRNLTLMVDHTFVYTPAIRQVSELVQQGELGDLYYYDSTRVNLGLFQRDVNVIWDLAVHDFAIMDHLFGQAPVAISACAASFVAGSPENMAHLTIHYDGGMMANLNVNWLAPVKIRQTLIGGSRKMVVYDDMQTSEKIKIYDRGATSNDKPYEHLVSYRIGDMYAPALSSKEALQTELQEFARAIESGTAPLTDGLGGLRVVEMLAAASRSCRLRGHPVDLVTLKEAS
ncbi:Gfo/Idh/MocA family oxidoreductase [Salipiger bermudensis]|uniref:Gfo/Idh/MocA family protein n=1 Tax=Salipiger bermudensis TaxID=344736 RepID=UPI001C990CBD|nr:Gfo/Idh/MocA family oxidoreductase [Salipiger bermudensis]MBY6004246.1 Gfo/Idh/MocA family oxidoreductase [Salipiger bermudensis]